MDTCTTEDAFGFHSTEVIEKFARLSPAEAARITAGLSERYKEDMREERRAGRGKNADQLLGIASLFSAMTENFKKIRVE